MINLEIVRIVRVPKQHEDEASAMPIVILSFVINDLQFPSKQHAATIDVNGLSIYALTFI